MKDEKPLDTSDLEGLSYRDKCLTVFAEKMSDRAFDPAAKKMARKIIGKSDEDAKIPLLTLLDCCVYCSWSSGIEIMILDRLYREAGGSEKELNATLDEREERAYEALGMKK